MSDMKWLRFIRKLKPYNIQKGLRYLKHYGPKEFLIRLSERMEPEEALAAAATVLSALRHARQGFGHRQRRTTTPLPGLRNNET